MDGSNNPYVIVAGVDYSEASRLAFRQALEIATRRLPSEVHVLNVEHAFGSYPTPYPGLVESAADVSARSLKNLQRFVADELAAFQKSQLQVGESPFGNVISHVRTQSPGQDIAQLAADLDADLVVVGTSGRTGVARFLMGSVANAVVTLSPCPVLVVREKKILPVGPCIEPPCPQCVAERRRTNGAELWCEQHREHHGQRHTYHQADRAGAETNFPLVFDRN